MPNHLRLIAAAVTLAVSAPAVAAPDALYIFSDSLIDSGNAFIGTGGQVADPAHGYFKGRFSNGYVWSDIVSYHLFGHVADPYLANPFVNTNYAVGGARAAGDANFPLPDGSVGVVPGLPNQNLFYQAQHGPVADPNALYIISFGNNDASAIKNGDTYGLTPQQYGALFVGNIVTEATTLYAQGARQIFIGGVPNPFDPVSLSLQAALDNALDALPSPVQDALIRYSYANFFTGLIADPTAYGLPANEDFFTPCLAVRPVVGGRVDCTGYFSLDGTHPTADIHKLLAADIARAIGAAVPEPAVWLQLIAGFGIMGAVVRRRRAVAA